MKLLKDVYNQMTSDLGNRRFAYQMPRGVRGKAGGWAQERAANGNRDQPRRRKVAAAAKGGGGLDAQTYVTPGTTLELKNVILTATIVWKNCIAKLLEGAEKLIDV